MTLCYHRTENCSCYKSQSTKTKMKVMTTASHIRVVVHISFSFLSLLYLMATLNVQNQPLCFEQSVQRSCTEAVREESSGFTVTNAPTN